MRPVYGLANTNSLDLHATIKKYRPKTKIFLQGNSSPETLPNYSIIVFSSVNYFEKNYDKISKNAYVFITDLALNLKRVKGIVLVDCNTTSSMRTSYYSLTDLEIIECLNSKESYPYEEYYIKSLDVFDRLFQKQPVSVLSDLFTLFYSIPNKERRLQIKTDILLWLKSSNDSDHDFEDLLKKLKLRKTSEIYLYLKENYDKLLLLRNEVVNGVKNKDNKVSGFDIRYLTKFNKPTKAKKSINFSKR